MKEGRAGSKEACDDERALDLDLIELGMGLGEVDDAKAVGQVPVLHVTSAEKPGGVEVCFIEARHRGIEA